MKLSSLVTPTSGGALALSIALGALAPPASAAPTRCTTSLPVTYSLPSSFVQSFTRSLPLTVRTAGPPVRRLYVAVYTFSGDLIGDGSLSRVLTGSATVRLRLRFALQPGAYTLYMQGYPNASASCGPKHLSKVLTLRGCATTLPVSFPDPPADAAASYTTVLPVQLSATGGLLRELRVTLSSFSGQVYGTTTFDPLLGTATVDIPLSQPLIAGPYTVYVSGTISGQPPSCGVASAKQAITLT
jgi:hypothetical protein